MKGLIYALAGLAAFAVIVFLVWYVMRVIRERQEQRAIMCARWEPYVMTCGDGIVEVGVRRVARRGRQIVKVVQGPEMITRIVTADLLSDELIDARSQAEMRASTYNSIATET